MKPPARIVSIVASNTELLYALGVGDRVVGVDDYSDFPPAVGALPRVGRDLDIDVDRVVALEPDLVLASLSVPGMERNVDRLAGRGLPLLVVRSRGLVGVLDDAIKVAAAVGAGPNGENLANTLSERVRRVEQRTRDVTERPRVYWEWWPRPFITAGGPSWMTDLCRLAGGENAFADLPGESETVTTEQIRARAPDVVVACWCGAKKLPDLHLFSERLGWENVPAVRNRRIHAVLEPLYGRPGPRLVDGLEALTALLHPGILQLEPC